MSDGGLVTCLLEMCFAGISGANVNITHKTAGSPIDILFAEEIGWLLEVATDDLETVDETFQKYEVPAYVIGKSTGLGMNSAVSISINGKQVVNSTTHSLMSKWEETSYQLERLQTNVDCAIQEFNGLKSRKVPAYKLTFDPEIFPTMSKRSCKVSVAVIREEGTNGDREMAASLYAAGFDVWDVTMQDLMNEKVTLEQFRGVIFPGGFSYAGK